MNPDLYGLVESAVLSGIVAIGFGAMFNVSWKNLGYCSAIAALASIIKNLSLDLGFIMPLASFLGALTAGVLATVASRRTAHPAVIFSIPAIIPMIPGVLGFKTILCALEILKLGANTSPEDVALTIHFALGTVFVAIALAVGVSLPSLTRKSKD
jgi:uncharacterized membrane protein YjjB (DUF3815 family)